MGRILAIDYGQKRTGLAVTDTLQLIANGLTTVRSNELISYLQAYFTSESVDLVVIGYPVQMNNTASEAVIYIDEFIRIFKKKFPAKKIELMDERFTSKMAFQTMIDGGLKKQQRRNKELVDKISATIILQSYMEMRQNLQNHK
jgi:putative holliday junction resolvase